MESAGVQANPETTTADMESAGVQANPETATEVVTAARKATNRAMNQQFTDSEMATCVLTAGHTKEQIDEVRLARVIGLSQYSKAIIQCKVLVFDD